MDFLETLKQGMQEAQKKFTAAQQRLAAIQSEFVLAQQKFNVAQAEFQQAHQEFNAYQTLVNSETRKRTPGPIATHQQAANPAVVQGNVAARVVAQMPAANRPATPLPAGVPVLNAAPVAPIQPETDSNKSEGNKTEAVRSLLRQHPTGMTPAEMWEGLKAQISNRVYLYSVLKRLKDRGQVREKRGKYYYNSVTEEPTAVAAPLQ